MRGVQNTKIHRYMEEAFYDAPIPSKRKEKSYCCDVAGMIDSAGFEYGWTPETTLSLPLKQLFQLNKAALQRKGAKRISNRSDRHIGAYVDSLNKRYRNCGN